MRGDIEHWVKPKNLPRLFVEVRKAVESANCKMAALPNRLGSVGLFEGSFRGRPNGTELREYIVALVESGRAPNDFCTWWGHYVKQEALKTQIAKHQQAKAEPADTAGLEQITRERDEAIRARDEALANLEASRDFVKKQKAKLDAMDTECAHANQDRVMLREATNAQIAERRRLEDQIKSLREDLKAAELLMGERQAAPNDDAEERIAELESEVEALQEMLSARPKLNGASKFDKAELLKEWASKGLVNFDAIAKMLE